MAGVISAELVSIYQSFIAIMPSWFQNFVNLFFLVLVILVYSIFVWKFYRFISTKDLIKLNLKKYNRSEHPIFSKFFGGIFYLIEYVVILPFLIFFWFGIFTLFLIFLTEGLEISSILVISAVIIGVIRIAAYYKEDVSREIAKLLPFTLLAISMTKPGFFDFERILGLFSQVPSFMGQVIGYLGFIVALEIILRFFDFIISLFGLNDEELPKEVPSPEEVSN